MVTVRRVYDEPSPDDGARVLTDRLWPRGIRKDALAHDEWCRDAAPSTELRRAFHGGDLDRAAFEDAYREELRREPAASAVAHLRRLAGRGPLTLLTATRDADRSYAHVLAEEVGRT